MLDNRIFVYIMMILPVTCYNLYEILLRVKNFRLWENKQTLSKKPKGWHSYIVLDVRGDKTVGEKNLV